jgi:hypothetical protein
LRTRQAIPTPELRHGGNTINAAFAAQYLAITSEHHT